MTKEFEVTPRGFKIYGKLEDSRGCTIRVQESSAVGRPCVYVFCNDTKGVYNYKDGSPDPHITVEQAEQMIQALQTFVEDAKSDENWRNDPEYIDNFG